MLTVDNIRCVDEEISCEKNLGLIPRFSLLIDQPSQVPSPSFLQFVFENFISNLCKPYSLNWYEFLITILSLLLNGMLQCWHFVIALKNIINNNIICYQKLNIIKFKYTN